MTRLGRGVGPPPLLGAPRRLSVCPHWRTTLFLCHALVLVQMNPELETLVLTASMGTSDINHILDLPRWHLLSAVWGDRSPQCCRILSIDGHCWSYRPLLRTPGGWETSRVLLLRISEATSRCPGGGTAGDVSETAALGPSPRVPPRPGALGAPGTGSAPSGDVGVPRPCRRSAGGPWKSSRRF